MGYYDSMNLFEYTLSNPVNWIDPTGKSLWDLYDFYEFYVTVAEFKDCKTFWNGFWLAVAVAGVLPIIPNLAWFKKFFKNDGWKKYKNWDDFLGRNKGKKPEGIYEFPDQRFNGKKDYIGIG